MADVLLERVSFAAGEASPPLQGRPDLARYQIAVRHQENMVTLPEGALTRRPGTRFVFPLKDESQVGTLVPYRFDGANAYVLVLNAGHGRVVKQGGFVLSGMSPYEFVIPWVAADLVNLRYAPWQASIYSVCPGYQPQTIAYAGDAAWTVAPYFTDGGPSALQNLDLTKTIIASGMLGIVTLSAEPGAARFSAGDVNAVWRLDEANFAFTPIWSADETITQPTQVIPTPLSNIGNFTNIGNAFDGNPATYATNTGSATQYIGQQFAATAIQSVAITSALDGFGRPYLCEDPATGLPYPVTLTLRGKVGVPANENDGVILAQIAGTTGINPTLYATDTVSQYTYFWVSFDADKAVNVGAAEIVWTRYDVGVAPTLRRWQNNVYEAITSGNTGATPPTHTAGDYQMVAGGVTFRYRHNGRGVVQITAVTDAAHATATVLDRIPDSVTTVATYRWFPPAWSGNAGWPAQVAFFQQRAWFTRKNSFWASRVGAPGDHTPYDTALGAADAALSGTLTPRTGTTAIIEWLIGSGILVAGANDGEWMVRTLDNTQAITATNVDADEDGDEGSCAHIPARVGNGVIYLGKSRKKLHFVAFDRLATQLTPEEISKTSRHILDGQGAWLAWQKDPNRVCWIGCLDGSLVGCTWMPKEQVVALHRHPLPNGFVEDGCAIAESDDAIVEVYLIVRRVINGQTHRYVERLQEFFPITLQADPSAGWFLDCALAFTVSGAPDTTVTGLNHLIGETVGVFVDGAVQTDKVVDNTGTITLDRPAKVGGLVGYRIPWRVTSLPLDIQTPQGTSAQQPKGANHVMVDMLNSAGGKISVNGGTPEALMRTGSHVPGTPIKLFTGRKRATTLDAEKDELVWEVTGNDPLPFTLRSVRLKADIEED